ncbi:hypothetical protein Bca101_054448 [Brassica carinata]
MFVGKHEGVILCNNTKSLVRAVNNGYYGYNPSVASYLPEKPQNIMNPVDSCWRHKSDWSANRKDLADCAVGFGSSALGGKKGNFYVVTNPNDNAANPKPGSLRYGVIQDKPLWITFAKDMVITLENELMVNSYKTIDGRGAKVEIAYGPCITIQQVTNVIVHGISIHDCKPAKYGMVRSSTTHVGHRKGSDGDAIAISGSSNIWIDHCYLASCTDGLIDVIHASTGITISNNYFTQHVKVMLLGHNDNFVQDVNMKVTVAFNHFGPGLVERMPRQVTKREVKGGWNNWRWRTSKDVFKNGAYFVPSGYGSVELPYSSAQRFPVAPGNMVPSLTADAGPLNCNRNLPSGAFAFIDDAMLNILSRSFGDILLIISDASLSMSDVDANPFYPGLSPLNDEAV